MFEDLDNEINLCNRCSDLVDHFPNSTTVSIGVNNNVLILGEAPANNGWRKSGRAWYSVDNKLLPSGVVLKKLLDRVNIVLEETYFLEAIKCFPISRKSLSICNNNCRDFLFRQLDIIKPKIILSLGDAPSRVLLGNCYKKFNEVVGKKFYINNYLVIPIYHPSPVSPMSYKGNEGIFDGIVKSELFMLDLIECLNSCWSLDTCFPDNRNLWNDDNRTVGQCAVTSLIVNDYMGGSINKIVVDGISHYFNIVNDEIIDLTSGQFLNINLDYNKCVLKSRNEMLSNDDTRLRYELLKSRVDLTFNTDMI